MRAGVSFQRLLLVALTATGVVAYKWTATPGRDWVRVARDANYEIALDRQSVRPVQVAWRARWYSAVDVSYRTDHALPRLHHDKTFNREIVRAIVQCDSMMFKVVSVDMLLGSGRPVVRQRMSDEELWQQPWRQVERGTTEEVAALAACHFRNRVVNDVAEGMRKP